MFRRKGSVSSSNSGETPTVVPAAAAPIALAPVALIGSPAENGLFKQPLARSSSLPKGANFLSQSALEARDLGSPRDPLRAGDLPASPRVMYYLLGRNSDASTSPRRKEEVSTQPLKNGESTTSPRPK